MNDRPDDGFDDALMAAAKELPAEVTPERDLWPGIEQAIAPPGASRRWAWSTAWDTAWGTAWAQAAAVVLMIGASSGITYLVMNDGSDPTSPVATGETLVFAPTSANFGDRYSLGPDFQDARSDLAGRLDEELERLSPEARAEVEKNLRTIRAAIDEINAALAEEPDNVLLQELLLSTYREELSLMIRVDGLASSVMRRNDI